MNLELKALLRDAEGRYFTDAEGARLVRHADDLIERLAVLEAIERAEPAILDDVSAAFFARDAAAGDVGKDARAKARRDHAQVLRYAALSMLQSDPNFIDDKLAVWLRTTMVALADAEHVLFGYRKLVEACERHLTAGDAALVVPYIRVVIDEFEARALPRSPMGMEAKRA